MTLSQLSNLNNILITIYCFVDDFLKGILNNIKYALKRPDRNTPPTRKHNLSLAELASLALFRFFAGHRNWFYGFKLHIICNELMQILNFRITAGNLDDRKGLEIIWNDIFGMIVADAGYLGANWQKKAHDLGKQLPTGVRANMKKIIAATQHQPLKLRQRVETVFSVLKLRFGIESTLSRSELGFF